MLKDCKTLKHLFLQFASGWDAYELGVDNAWTNLEGFQDLTSLELYHFNGEESKITRDLAKVLAVNSGLKKLGLGRSHDAISNFIPEAIISNGKYNFMQRLCKQYAALQGTAPLHLEILRLGHGMFLRPLETADAGNYLSNLTRLNNVKILHIFNGDFLETRDDNEFL